MFIIGGLFGSADFGIWVEKKKTFKLAVIIISIGSTISVTLLVASLISQYFILTTLICFIVGFFMIPIMPVGFEFGVELTHPIGEALPTGYLMSSG